MSTLNFQSELVKSLLTRGAADWQEWDDYLSDGFSAEHIPELIKIATNRFLLVEANEPEFWAPAHAWRVLAQLGAKEAIDPLVGVFNFYEAADSDLISEVLPQVFEKLGPACLPSLAAYLIEPRHNIYARTTASNAIIQVAKQYPESKEQGIGIITAALELLNENEEELNGSLISDLIDLGATGAMPSIRRAFEAGAVDITVAGDLEDVEIELGLRTERETPSRGREAFMQKYPQLAMLGEKFKEIEQNQKQVATKHKSKQKQAKKSRKRNRKK